MPQPKGQAAAAQKLHERATLEISNRESNSQKVTNLKQTRINGNGSLSVFPPPADESRSTDSEGEEESEDQQITKTPKSYNSNSSLTRTSSGSLTSASAASASGSLKRKHSGKAKELLLKIDQSYAKRLRNKVDNLINKLPNDNSEFRLIYFKMYVHYIYMCINI